MLHGDSNCSFLASEVFTCDTCSAVVCYCAGNSEDDSCNDCSCLREDEQEVQELLARGAQLRAGQLLATGNVYRSHAGIDLAQALPLSDSPTMAIPWLVSALQSLGKSRQCFKLAGLEWNAPEYLELDDLASKAHEMINRLAGCPGGVLPLAV